jgi:mono/diheme cytochrome c family protein
VLKSCGVSDEDGRENMTRLSIWSGIICRLGLVGIMMLLIACGQQKETGEKQSQAVATKTQRYVDFDQVAHGGRLFHEHCAACHGANAQGAANWRQKGADGKYPPPPLDGTGHAWHHPKNILVMTIREGTGKLGGSMPAWGNKLSTQDMDDIIAWFQAKWSDEIYTEWVKRDSQAN